MKHEQIQEEQGGDATLLKVGLDLASHVGHYVRRDFELFPGRQNDDPSDRGEYAERDNDRTGGCGNSVPEVGQHTPSDDLVRERIKEVPDLGLHVESTSDIAVQKVAEPAKSKEAAGQKEQACHMESEYRRNGQ